MVMLHRLAIRIAPRCNLVLMESNFLRPSCLRDNGLSWTETPAKAGHHGVPVSFRLGFVLGFGVSLGRWCKFCGCMGSGSGQWGPICKLGASLVKVDNAKVRAVARSC